MNLTRTPESISKELDRVAQALTPKALTLHTNVGMLGVLEGPFTKEWQLSEYHRLIWQAFEGTSLLYPTFNYDFLKNGVYDVKNDICKVGSLNEHVRKTHLERRTHTPVFNFCILGNHPHPIQTISENPFSRESVFSNIAEGNSWIGFMGAGFDTNTFVHYVEEEMNIGYRYIKTFKGRVIAENTQRAVTFRYRVRPLQQGAVDYDWVRLERDLLNNGLMKVFSVGLGELKVVEGKELYDYWLANLKRDEWFLLTEESKMILRELSKRHRYPFTFEEMEAATIKKEGG